MSLVNNAGYGHFGTIEELTEDEARAQIETNVFGALWVTQAALPRLREQGSGHILQVSSVGGVNAFPTIGIYNASKWALEAFSQALAGEVAPFGIRVTIVEPAGFATDWGGPSSVHSEPIAAYDAVRRQMQERRAQLGAQPRRPRGDRSRDPRARRRARAPAAAVPRPQRARAHTRRIRTAPPDAGTSGTDSPSAPRATLQPVAS